MKSKKLPKAFKQKWVKALRSGKYKQGRNELRSSDNTYCCLGVAAHIAGASCITGRGVIDKEDGIRGITKIPELIIGDSTNNKVVNTLITMNDSRNYSFSQIADWIDKNL